MVGVPKTVSTRYSSPVPESEPSPEPPTKTPSDRKKKPSTADPTRAQNPGAGCLIMIVALVSLAFLVGFGIWSLFKQHREISKFTDPSPQEIAVPDLEANAQAVIGLNAKLETFRTEAGNKREALLKLSAEELNLAFAAFKEFEELRGTFRVKEITAEEVHIEIAFKMRGAPTKPEDFRYLNGTMITRPQLTGGEIIFEVTRIEVSGKTVPDGFVGVFSPYRPAQMYLEDEALGPWMKRLTSLTLEDGFATLAIIPADTPPAAEPPDIELPHILRAAVLFGAILLGFTAIVIMAIKRGRR